MQDKAIITVEDLDGVTLKMKGGKVTAEAATTVGGASEWGVVPVTATSNQVQHVDFKRSYTKTPTVMVSLSDPNATRHVALRGVTPTGFDFASNYLFTNQTLHYVVYSND